MDPRPRLPLPARAGRERGKMLPLKDLREVRQPNLVLVALSKRAPHLLSADLSFFLDDPNR
jgi:hypothetical protein